MAKLADVCVPIIPYEVLIVKLNTTVKTTMYRTSTLSEYLSACSNRLMHFDLGQLKGITEANKIITFNCSEVGDYKFYVSYKDKMGNVVKAKDYTMHK